MPSAFFTQLAAFAVIAPVVLAQSAISPAAAASRCAQPQHGSMIEGTPIVLGPCSGAAEQTFFLENGGVRVFSNMCVQAGAANGDVATIGTCDTTRLEQQWTYDAASRTFQSATGSCLDLSHGATNIGATIGTWACSPSASNQIWDVVNGVAPPAETTTTDAPAETTTSTSEESTTTTSTPAGEPTDVPAPPAEGTVTIKPTLKDNLCLAAAENKDGAPVVFAECNGDESQKWVNEKVGSVGTFRVFGDKCIDVTEGRNERGTKMQIWSCVGRGSNQLFEQKGEHIVWHFFNRCLDATDGIFRVGQQAQIWQCSQSKNQNWIIG
ncbi:ricin B lectin domain-containing protein [Auriculariales sp. MPI-PUGE-AT-0066]|nr:ricin B lectin domain-containing protein [Auriculariales sp. MPI-PUGE-AT-0066]